jgi:hypothetical protein
MHNLTLKVWEKKIGMEQGMFIFKHLPKEVEYTSEDKVYF